MGAEVTKIHGMPGAGKTTSLLKTILKKEIPLKQLTFCTHRKSVAAEVLLQFPDDQITKNHGTIHAVALNCLRESRGKYDVLGNEDKEMFFRGLNIDINTEKGKLILSAVSWHAQYESFKGYSGRKDFFALGLSEANLAEITENYALFKEEKEVHDFNDILFDCINDGLSPTDYVFIDEFQDISPLQFDLIQLWINHAKVVVIAGDPFQSIQSWAGGSPKYWGEIKGKDILLKYSYRLCQNLIDYAWKIIGKQEPPEVESYRKGETCQIRRIMAQHLSGVLPSAQDNTARIERIIDHGSTLHLFRTRHYFRDKRDIDLLNKLDQIGEPYTCQDGQGWDSKTMDIHNLVHSYRKGESKISDLKEFLIPSARDMAFQTDLMGEGGLHAQLHSSRPYSRGFIFNEFSPLGTRLTAAARFGVGYVDENAVSTRVMTIHAAKGLECDTCFLYDGMTQKTTISMFEERGSQIEEEERVWFVGATRAKKNLNIIQYPSRLNAARFIP